MKRKTRLDIQIDKLRIVHTTYLKINYFQMTDIENGKWKNSELNFKKVKKVSIHPDFDAKTKMPDLAILKLKNGFSIPYGNTWPNDIIGLGIGQIA